MSGLIPICFTIKYHSRISKLTNFPVQFSFSPTVSHPLGFPLISAGVSLWLHVSFLAFLTPVFVIDTQVFCFFRRSNSRGGNGLSRARRPPVLLTFAGFGHLLSRSLLGLQQLLDSLWLTRHVGAKNPWTAAPRRNKTGRKPPKWRSAERRICLLPILTAVSWRYVTLRNAHVTLSSGRFFFFSTLK